MTPIEYVSRPRLDEQQAGDVWQHLADQDHPPALAEKLGFLSVQVGQL